VTPPPTGAATTVPHPRRRRARSRLIRREQIARGGGGSARRFPADPSAEAGEARGIRSAERGSGTNSRESPRVALIMVTRPPTRPATALSLRLRPESPRSRCPRDLGLVDQAGRAELRNRPVEIGLAHVGRVEEVDRGDRSLVDDDRQRPSDRSSRTARSVRRTGAGTPEAAVASGDSPSTIRSSSLSTYRSSPVAGSRTRLDSAERFTRRYVSPAASRTVCMDQKQRSRGHYASGGEWSASPSSSPSPSESDSVASRARSHARYVW